MMVFAYNNSCDDLIHWNNPPKCRIYIYALCFIVWIILSEIQFLERVRKTNKQSQNIHKVGDPRLRTFIVLKADIQMIIFKTAVMLSLLMWTVINVFVWKK